jgi:hypothetical protein
MHKKKKTAKGGMSENAKKIYQNDDYVIRVAMQLYDSGQKTSPIAIYHAVKEKLKLPAMYNFDSGDAIKQILHEEGWIQE